MRADCKGYFCFVRDWKAAPDRTVGLAGPCTPVIVKTSSALKQPRKRLDARKLYSGIAIKLCCGCERPFRRH